MAKRFHKQSAQSEKARVGCLQGLIRMFHIRHSTRNLLQDKKDGTFRHAGTGYSKYNPDKELTWERKPEDAIGVNVKKAGAVTSGKTIIEELTEDDISCPLKKYPNPGVERIRHHSGFKSNVEKEHEQMTRNYIATSDHHATDLRTSVDTASCQSSCGYQSETPNCNLDPALVVDVNHQYEEKQMNLENMTGHADHRKSNVLNGFDIQLTIKKSNLRNALCDVTEASPNQNSLHAGLLNGNRNIYHSEDLMDTLSLPNTNKESFLKFFEDDLVLKFQNARARKFSKMESGKILEGSNLSEKEEGCLEKYKDLVSQKLSHKQNALLLMENKQKGTRSSKRSDTSSGLTRIVLLKPNLSGNPNPILFIPDNSKQSDYGLQHEEGTERIASHFSPKESKRTLCYGIGQNKKEKVQIAMDGVLHRVPYKTKGYGNTDKRNAAENVERGLSNKTTGTVEHTAQSPIKRRNRRTELKECLPNMKSGPSLEVDCYKKLVIVEGSETISHDDAKEHHALMLGTGGRNEPMFSEKTPNTLATLLYWSDDDIVSLTPHKMRSSPTRKVIHETHTKQLSPFQKKIESLLLIDRKQDDGVYVLHTNNKSREDLNSEECTETIEAVDAICTEERDYSAVSSETGSKDSSFTVERCEEEGSSMLSVLLQGSVEEMQQPVPSFISLSGKPLFVQNLEVPQVLTETPERPSPVSILEPFFFDNVNSPENTIKEHEVELVLMGTLEHPDPVSVVKTFFVDNINSPDSTTTKHDESSVQPGQSHFKDHDISAAVTLSSSEVMIVTHVKDVEFRYVRSLLQASGMSYDNLLERWYLSDSLLGPLPFDDARISSSRLPRNQKLIYDCTNEVLVEILSRCFSCVPWLHYIEPSLQGDLLENNLVQKVHKGVHRHLHSQLACTMDQTMRKDLDCGGWMKLRRETESILFDMADDILEDLIEELY